MYRLLLKLLFTLNPEHSHYIALKSLGFAYRSRLTKILYQTQYKPSQIMGLHFPNFVGLAAGLDKNGDYIDALAALGFGFIEIGTLTPKPQAGNIKPRLFRLTENEAIINRMGFNNKGVLYAASNLEKMRYRGVLGINIGKNKDTPLEEAVDDYLFGFRHLWKFASYFTINLSSPNTKDLRKLQHGEMLENLLAKLKEEQKRIHQTENKYVPLVVKIAPDLTTNQIHEMSEVFLKLNIDGVIATNTTTSRLMLQSQHAHEAGGLSGKPLNELNTNVIRVLAKQLKNNIPIIASGGITDKLSAHEKIKAGASLLQVYTGFIYQGPRILNELLKICN